MTNLFPYLIVAQVDGETRPYLSIEAAAADLRDAEKPIPAKHVDLAFDRVSDFTDTLWAEICREQPDAGLAEFVGAAA